jgi:ferredoxin
LTSRRSAPPRWVLEVDPIQCRAHGLCAELLPEVVDLDEWGYPLFRRAIPPILLTEARAAVQACPTLALRVTRADSTG